MIQFASRCVALALLATALAAPAAEIPMCPGLTIVTAVNQKGGDYESIKTVQKLDAGELRLKFSAEAPNTDELSPTYGQIVRRTNFRKVLLADVQSATLYQQIFMPDSDELIPGTTSIGTSAQVLRELKTSGASPFSISVIPNGQQLRANRQVQPNAYDFFESGTLKRVGTEKVAVLINDRTVQLPTVRARGEFGGAPSEFVFLDDESNPLTLKLRIGANTMHVVRIAHQCGGSGLERALQDSGKIDVYSIYFSFNSDALRDESSAALQELGVLMRKHLDWKLAIYGHTDNVASDSYNLDLSRRRAIAVATALSKRYGVDPARLSADGRGESAPRDTNDTLEGRAKNRRVEFVRIP